MIAKDGAGQNVGQTRSGSDGRYEMTLPAGSYTIVVDTGARYPYCPETQVDVPPRTVVTADISCDTGIR